eukprot:GFYU01005749.1.p1 GENE.GFYU01005749.1~~GFYU01005749.1.p1  ORF type:complete len:340 (-),score=66.55 GFYU01005749.1:7-1026(-)
MTHRLEKATCVDLYNRITVRGSLIIIDARPVSHYDEKHIPYAVSLEPQRTSLNDPDTLLDEIIARCDNEDTTKAFNFRKYCEVYFYCWGDDREGDDVSLHWISRLCTLFADEGLVTRVVLLKGGFAQWSATYPFLSATTGVEHPITLPYPNEILDDFMYLSGTWQSRNEDMMINHLKITHIVNATLECPSCFEDKGVIYLPVEIPDEEHVNIRDYFNTVIEFIQKAKDSGGKVLVHCVQGMSRSATLVIAYLMTTYRWTLRESYTWVKKKREMIYPNKAFLIQLRDYEIELFGTPTLTLEDIEMTFNGVTRYSEIFDTDHEDSQGAGGRACQPKRCIIS